MKSQDIVLLFKMASLNAQEENIFDSMDPVSNSAGVEPRPLASYPNGLEPDAIILQGRDLASTNANDEWESWSDPTPSASLGSWSEHYSLRALSASLGLSKSEVSNAMARCRRSGLLTDNYETGQPRVNRRELVKITEHALKYFFPVKPGAMVRGIPTAFAAPALSKNIRSAGGLIPVWPDAFGTERGQAVEPLYKTVPQAVKKDRTMYHYLALADAVRLGGPRECGVAINILKAGMGLK